MDVKKDTEKGNDGLNEVSKNRLIRERERERGREREREKERERQEERTNSQIQIEIAEQNNK